MGNNTYDMSGKTKRLLIFSIICYVLLYGGLVVSYLFWKNYVNNMFGLFIPFTFLFYIFMNIIFKIPSLLDILFLAHGLSLSIKLNDSKSRSISIVLLVIDIISVIIGLVADLIMIWHTRGSDLG
ncbi:MAG: hypothetical protein K6B68_16750 [Eubacterium sp.]|nr:hypothetical protein [Eubacterium sp.]